MSATAVMEQRFEVSDVSGQKVLSLPFASGQTTIAEVVRDAVAQMRLPAEDVHGRRFTYHMRLDREGRHLLGSERVTESVVPGDRLVMQPNVDAGGPAARGGSPDGIRPALHPRWQRCSSLEYCPIFSLLAPCHRGASPVSVLAGTSTTGC